MIKISFVGDIMCESPFLNAAVKRPDGFEPAFSGLAQVFETSDFVVGNVETPFAGEFATYTTEMYSFNTPDAFAAAVKNMGVSLALTANNHCCDRGIDGLKRTLQVLDDIGLMHTGTFCKAEENQPAYFEIRGTKFAVISATESTNAILTRVKASTEYVNLLREQTTKRPIRTLKDLEIRVKLFAKRLIGEENYIRYRLKKGLPPKKPTVDQVADEADLRPYVEHIQQQIKRAKENADVVFICPHMGGQFNLYPGTFCEYMMDKFVEAGVDAVVASHPHIIQKADVKRGVVCAYSIGNVSMSMSTLYVLKENLPDYGMVMHFYIEDRKIEKVTYSIIRATEDASGYLCVSPVNVLYDEASENEKKKIFDDTQRIVRRIRQDESVVLSDIPAEFPFWQKG